MGWIEDDRDPGEPILGKGLGPELSERLLREPVLKVELYSLRGQGSRGLEAHRARWTLRSPFPDRHLARPRSAQRVDHLAPGGVARSDGVHRCNLVAIGWPCQRCQRWRAC